MYDRRLFLKHVGVAASALAFPEVLRAETNAGLATPLIARDTGPELPLVRNVDLQPLIAQVKRILAAMDYLGAPLAGGERSALEDAFRLGDASSNEASERIQRVLDRSCLVGVEINPEARVKVLAGPAAPELVQNGWRQFLVKVHNEAGSTAALRGASMQARRLAGSPPEEIADRWLDLTTFDRQPLTETLSGLVLEYRIVQLYSRDAGNREATIG